MREFGTGSKAWLLSSALLFGGTFVAGQTQAAQPAAKPVIQKSTAAIQPHPINKHTISSGVRYSGGRQCVAMVG